MRTATLQHDVRLLEEVQPVEPSVHVLPSCTALLVRTQPVTGMQCGAGRRTLKHVAEEGGATPPEKVATAVLLLHIRVRSFL